MSETSFQEYLRVSTERHLPGLVLAIPYTGLTNAVAYQVMDSNMGRVMTVFTIHTPNHLQNEVRDAEHYSTTCIVETRTEYVENTP